MNERVIVDTAWLQNPPSAVVVVDVRSPQTYKRGHIPGAVNLPLSLLQWPGGGSPDRHHLSSRLGRAGISRETHIVAYDDGASPSAAVLFWVLTYLGHPVVSVLDGGIAKWVYEGRDCEIDEVEPTSVDYVIADPDLATLADAKEVYAAMSSDDSVILDVRSAAEYLGLQRTAGRNGHVPGAVNIDWQDNLTTDANGISYLRDDDALRRLYESAGITPNKNIIVHCHSGVRACETYMVLKKLGYPRVTHYDAGWQDWGNRPDTMVDEG